MLLPVLNGYARLFNGGLKSLNKAPNRLLIEQMASAVKLMATMVELIFLHGDYKAVLMSNYINNFYQTS